MQPESKCPRRVIGIDFSGAADAGRRVWIAELSAAAHGLTLVRCDRGDRWLGVAPAREPFLAGLAAWLVKQGPGVIGLDTAFSLPAGVLDRPWAGFVESIAARFADARAMRVWCSERGGGRELKRVTDRVARTPFSPYNLRMASQTFHGMRDVLGPAAVRGGAGALGLAPAQPGRPMLAEVCPASLLKAVGGYGRPYKGRTATHADARRAIVRLMRSRLGLTLDRADRAVLISEPGGDALDAVLCGIAAAGIGPDAAASLPGEAAAEGWVFFDPPAGGERGHQLSGSS